MGEQHANGWRVSRHRLVADATVGVIANPMSGRDVRTRQARKTALSALAESASTSLPSGFPTTCPEVHRPGRVARDLDAPVCVYTGRHRGRPAVMPALRAMLRLVWRDASRHRGAAY